VGQGAGRDVGGGGRRCEACNGGTGEEDGFHEGTTADGNDPAGIDALT
jgi:hypothetical protein